MSAQPMAFLHNLWRFTVWQANVRDQSGAAPLIPSPGAGPERSGTIESGIQPGSKLAGASGRLASLWRNRRAGDGVPPDPVNHGRRCGCARKAARGTRCRDDQRGESAPQRSYSQASALDASCFTKDSLSSSRPTVIVGSHLPESRACLSSPSLRPLSLTVGSAHLPCA